MALSPRILVLAELLAALLLGIVVYAFAAGAAPRRDPAPPPSSPLPVPDGGNLAGGSTAGAANSPTAVATPALDSVSGAGAMAEPHPSGEVDILAAVVVVRRVCTLVDRRAYAAARWLFADTARWPAGLWRRLRHIRFRSARVISIRDGASASPVVHLNVRVATPASRRGVRTLAFTLGRVGSDGEWLVYAVSTPIPPRERGPSCPPSPTPPIGFSPG